MVDITDETIRLVTHESDRPETATHLRQIGVDVIPADRGGGRRTEQRRRRRQSDARWILTDAVSMSVPRRWAERRRRRRRIGNGRQTASCGEARRPCCRVHRTPRSRHWRSIQLSVGLSQPSSAASLGGASGPPGTPANSVSHSRPPGPRGSQRRSRLGRRTAQLGAGQPASDLCRERARPGDGVRHQVRRRRCWRPCGPTSIAPVLGARPRHCSICTSTRCATGSPGSRA